MGLGPSSFSANHDAHRSSTHRRECSIPKICSFAQELRQQCTQQDSRRIGIGKRFEKCKLHFDITYRNDLFKTLIFNLVIYCLPTILSIYSHSRLISFSSPFSRFPKASRTCSHSKRKRKDFCKYLLIYSNN